MIKDELPYYTNVYIKEFMSQCDQYQRVEYWVCILARRPNELWDLNFITTFKDAIINGEEFVRMNEDLDKSKIYAAIFGDFMHYRFNPSELASLSFDAIKQSLKDVIANGETPQYIDDFIQYSALIIKWHRFTEEELYRFMDWIDMVLKSDPNICNGDKGINIIVTEIFKYQILSDKFIKANSYLSNMTYRPNIEYLDEVLSYNQFLEEVTDMDIIDARIYMARTSPTKPLTRDTNKKDQTEPVKPSIFQRVKNVLNKL